MVTKLGLSCMNENRQLEMNHTPADEWENNNMGRIKQNLFQMINSSVWLALENSNIQNEAKEESTGNIELLLSSKPIQTVTEFLLNFAVCQHQR